MAEGKARREWDHTASCLAMLANIPLLVWGKGPQFQPGHFNPYGDTPAADTGQRFRGKEGFAVFKSMFGDRRYGANGRGA